MSRHRADGAPKRGWQPPMPDLEGLGMIVAAMLGALADGLYVLSSGGASRWRIWGAVAEVSVGAAIFIYLVVVVVWVIWQERREARARAKQPPSGEDS